jgi:low temperature requirement protein LtrA
MRRMPLKWLLFTVLFVAFLAAEALFALYVHRTKAKINYLYSCAEAAARRAEEAAR